MLETAFLKVMDGLLCFFGGGGRGRFFSMCRIFQARTADLCGVILDVIFNVYSSDQANYFILEQQHTLPHFIEKVSTKSIKIQVNN